MKTTIAHYHVLTIVEYNAVRWNDPSCSTHSLMQTGWENNEDMCQPWFAVSFNPPISQNWIDNIVAEYKAANGKPKPGVALDEEYRFRQDTTRNRNGE